MLLICCICVNLLFQFAYFAQADSLEQLVGKRLELSAEVAKAKWNRGDPIEDPAREKQLLDRVALLAEEFDVPGELAREFFRQQIEDSKKLQRQLFERWRAQRAPPWKNARSLPDLRRELDALTPRILERLHNVYKSGAPAQG